MLVVFWRISATANMATSPGGRLKEALELGMTNSIGSLCLLRTGEIAEHGQGMKIAPTQIRSSSR